MEQNNFNNQQNKQKVVFLLRHGERGDKSQEEKEQKRLEKHYDCHLTDHGCIQAEQAGIHVGQFIQKQTPHIKKICLISSPMLRCIMTAENVQKGLGLEVLDEQILIENCVCELLITDLFKECPMKQGIILRESEKKIQEYVKSIKVNDVNDVSQIPEFPEGATIQDTYDRSYNSFKYLCSKFFEDFEKSEKFKDTALVIVSHGGLVQGVLEKLGIFEKDIGYPLTNINGFVFENKEQEKFEQLPKILCSQYQDHLPEAARIYQQQ